MSKFSRGAYRFNPETNEPDTGWLKVSNLLIEYLCPNRVSGQLQLEIILYIARHTWSANDKQTWLRLSISKIAKIFECSRQAVQTALEDAITRGIIERTWLKTGAPASYRLTQWIDVPDYKRPEQPADTETTQASQLNVVARQLILFPGKHSRWFTIRIGERDQQVKCCNETSQPVTLALEITPDGSLLFAARHPKEQAKPEADRTSPLVRFSNQPEENKQVTENERPQAKPQQKHLKFPAPKAGTAIPEEDTRTVAYRSWLASLMLGRWHKALDGELFFQVVKATKEAPLNVFSDVVMDRLKRDSLRKLGPGILIPLATDAARAHEALKAQEALEAKAREPQQPRESGEEFHERMVREYGEVYTDLVKLDGAPEKGRVMIMGIHQRHYESRKRAKLGHYVRKPGKPASVKQTRQTRREILLEAGNCFDCGRRPINRARSKSRCSECLDAQKVRDRKKNSGPRFLKVFRLTRIPSVNETPVAA